MFLKSQYFKNKLFTEGGIPMNQIPYCDSNGVVSVTVQLQHASNVFLVDQQNFNAYRSGQSFRYIGGFYDHTPIQLRANGVGRWYLIIDNGSGEQFSYRWN